MKRRSIRARITVGFAVLTIGVLLALDLGAYTFTRRRLFDDVDSKLRLCATVLGSEVEINAGQTTLEVTEAVKAQFGPDAPRFFQIWTNADRVPVEHSKSLEALHPALGVESVFEHLYDGFELEHQDASWTISKPGSEFRVHAAVRKGRLSDEPQPADHRTSVIPEVVVVVGERLDGVLHSLSHLLVGLLAGTAGAVVLAIGLAWWLSRGIMRPLVTVTAAAQNIGLSGTSDTVPRLGTGDEIDALADTLNATFSRLRESFERERCFAADASHELRTPVAIIRSQTEVALLDPTKADSMRRALETVRDAAERMQHVIEGLLHLARIAEPGLRPPRTRVDLCRASREEVGACKTEAERKRLTMALDCPGVVEVSANEDQLHLALSNVISNAIRYSELTGRVAVSVEASNGVARIRVADQGVGIPPEHVSRVFDRFYRVDDHRNRENGGAGLGLAIVKDVIEAHGGSVSIESTVGQGTTVTIELPRAAEPSPLASSTPPDRERAAQP